MGKEEIKDGMNGSLIRCNAIISYLDEAGATGVSEIAQELDRPKSSVHKYLKTLEFLEFVENDGGVYRLGLRFLEIGGRIRNRNPIFQVARPLADELANDIDEVIFISVKNGNYGVFVYQTNNRYGIENLAPLGERFYLHQNAAGKAMLAECSKNEIDQFISKSNLPPAMEKTTTDPNQLRTELNRIRDEGYSVGKGERFEGIRAISAAIPDGESGAIGALSVVVPDSGPVANKLESKSSEAVMRTANEISLALKYDE
ncbi:IclR family transcriptional regulator [Halorarum salinum]|uniref:IclR family transcriptional regulator n=1 Tax=Halorarum salinum TaxID=2743089 RepID=A0A7D5QBL9_9EURY|nr:IclR family transcriptional regulator [Halobaculum salinum]QLG61920.1 IclR family transcriptional regulator [Halobaculum salinum]